MAQFGARLTVLILLMVVETGLCTVHTVGETAGWSLGTDYATWATGKTFAPGDSLKFNYESGHTVDEVSESDYKSCITGNAISSESTGPTTITLKTPGTHYFICGVPGHCSGGMKVAVTVGKADGGPTAPSAGGGTTTKNTTVGGMGEDSPPMKSGSRALSPLESFALTWVAALFVLILS